MGGRDDQRHAADDTTIASSTDELGTPRRASRETAVVASATASRQRGAAFSARVISSRQIAQSSAAATVRAPTTGSAATSSGARPRERSAVASEPACSR